MSFTREDTFLAPLLVAFGDKMSIVDIYVNHTETKYTNRLWIIYSKSILGLFMDAQCPRNHNSMNIGFQSEIVYLPSPSFCVQYGQE